MCALFVLEITVCLHISSFPLIHDTQHKHTVITAPYSDIAVNVNKMNYPKLSHGMNTVVMIQAALSRVH